MRKVAWLTFAIVAVAVLFSSGPAQAGNGTLKGTFVYKDSATNVETVLTSGYIYLHSASNSPPMEKFLSKADMILSTGANPFTVSVPEGSYYIRIMQRVGSTSSGPYGPPRTGDYTWMQQQPIKIVAGATLNLNKVYAVPYAASPITVTGTVKTSSGTPLQGWYVRAQVEPCLPPQCTDGVCSQTGNMCGPVKNLALRPTDANGNFTLMLADNGTYYLYSSPCLMRGHNLYDQDRCQYNAAANAPIAVKRGDSVKVDITGP